MIARSLLSPFDLHLFNEGTHGHLFEKLGAHLFHDPDGTYFAVWAPNADAVSVMGDFNGWDKDANGLYPRESSGIWEGFIPGVKHGALYKYYVHSRVTRNGVEKADPFATFSEAPPRQASIVWDLDYRWGDEGWMESRRGANGRGAPWSVYEMHIGSWMRVPDEQNRWLTYRELAPRLADYVSRVGFTHGEFMAVRDHPLYQSGGYQFTGYFAPTSRYGTPQDFMFLVDYLHQNGVGVILDWVPSHFPADEFGLQNFDGTHLFEHADPRMGVHPDWGSSIFNYGRNEVRGFLLSSALCWLDHYHADGLRVDAVASMLYLDYSRKRGEWIPNKCGGNENLDAVDFLRRFNIEVYKEEPDTQTVAEESTAWPFVSRPTYVGGLGLRRKWDLGVGNVHHPPPALRLDVRAAGQEAHLHGRGVRAVEGVGRRVEPRLAPPRYSDPRRPAVVGRRPQSHPARGEGASRARLRPGGVLLDRRDRCRPERGVAHAPRPVG